MKRFNSFAHHAEPIQLIRRALLICACALALLPASATHLSGGEITWSCLGPNQYRVSLTLFRDCAGTTMQPTAALRVVGSNLSYTAFMPLESSSEVTQLCPALMPSSACNGGALPGLERYTYAMDLPLSSGQIWSLSYTEVYRNAAVVNLITPDNVANHIHAQINTVLAPCNDSPHFTNTPIPYVCVGQPVQYSYGAYDSDGDSLSYELISALGSNAVPLAYVWPNSASSPIAGIQINAVTGALNFTPMLSGNWVVVVKVTQFNSSGQALGHVIRDMQFVVYACTNDQPDPDTGLIENLSGACMLTGPRSIELCQSGSFCFTFEVTDPNAGDALTAVSNVSANLPGATFSWTAGNPGTGVVCWIAQPGFTGLFPFIVQVSDGACPVPGEQTYVFAVYVSQWLQAGLEVIDESCAGLGNGSAAVTVASGEAPYTYQWSTGATGPAMAGGAGNYSLVLIDANGCTTPVVPFTIGTTTPPVALAGPDLALCASQASVPLAGTVQEAVTGSWSGGTGSFSGQWPAVSYIPSNADIAQGGVALTLTASSSGGCPPATDTMQIDFASPIIGDLTVTPVSCAGAADGTAQFAPDAPGLGYAWNDPAQQSGPTATGLAGGAYALTITDAFGCTRQIQFQVDEPAALALLGMTMTPETCAGMGSGSLAPQVSGGTPPYSYAWSNGIEDPVLFGSGGAYAVSISDANGCPPITAQGTITTASLPNQADAGPDQFLCAAAAPISLQGSVVNATGGVWSGGSGTFTGSGLAVSYSPTAGEIATGEVTLTLTTTGNSACPPGTDSMTVHLGATLSALNLIATPITCAGAADGAASVQPVLAGCTYEWIGLPGEMAPSVSGLQAGNWPVHVIGPGGCDTLLIASIMEPPPLDLFIATYDAACFGDSTGTATAMVDGGTPAYMVTWSNGLDAPEATMLPAGPIGVVVTDANGCTASAMGQIGQAAPMMAWVSVPDSVCAGASFTLAAGAQGGNAGYTYAWSGLGSGDSLTVSLGATQTVVMQAQDVFGCVAAPISFTIAVLDLNDAALAITDDTLVCPGSNVALSAQVLGYPGATSISWAELGVVGSGPHTVLALSDTVIHVLATDACGAQLIDSVMIAVDELPVVDWPPVIAQGCAPLTVQLQPPEGTEGMSFQWFLGAAGSSNEPAPTAQFPEGLHTISLLITTAYGCTMATPAQGSVEAYLPPTAEFSTASWTLCTSQAEAGFTDESSGAVTGWEWDFGDGGGSSEQSPTHSFGAAGNYVITLTVANAQGCTSSVARMIEVLADHQIAIPNAFTPNPAGPNGGYWNRNDLSNDVFFPLASDLSEYELVIFNRWGEVLFESRDPRMGWDGYHRDRLCPADGYVYRINATFTDGQRLSRTGPFTLIR